MYTKRLLVVPGAALSLALICLLTWQWFAPQTHAQAESCAGKPCPAPEEVKANSHNPPALPDIIEAANVDDGGFESGANVEWTEYSALGVYPLVVDSTVLTLAGVTPHSGNYAAWLGGVDDETAFISQTVAITTGESTLSYRQWIDSEDLCGYDFGSVLINGSEVYSISLCSSTNTYGWVYRTLNLSAYIGQDVDLQFRVETDGSLNSNLFIDDVSLGQGHYVYLPCINKNACGFHYFDDFGNPNSGWVVGDDPERTYGYLNEEYQILLKNPNSRYLITPDLVLPNNYRIEVEAYQPSTVKDTHGLAFGIRWNGGDWESYQFLVYPPSQVYLLGKTYMNGTWVTLIDPTYNSAINPNSTNHLRVDRVGSTIRLYINGVQVSTVTDASFTGAGRDAGLRVYSTDDGAPVDTRFDNFRADCIP